jgi:hypothetical protein
MSNEDNVVTLPEITVEGSADSQPMNSSDWWCQGFTVGFNAPDTLPERPLMINDDLATSFFAGVESGQNSSREMQIEFDERFRDSPQVVPDIGGEAFDEVQRRYDEAWEELFHEHMPHTEVEGEPGPTFVRPPIIIIPE